MKIGQLKVGTRLGGGFTVVIVLVLLVSALGAWRLRSVDSAVSHMIGSVMYKERLFSEWANNTNLNGARAMSVADSQDPARQQQIQAKIKQTSARISEIQKILAEVQKTPEEQALFDQISAKRVIYVAARDDVFKAKEADPDSAKAMMQARLEPALDDYVATISKLSTYQANTLSGIAGQTATLAQESAMLMALLAALAVLVGGAIAVLVTPSIRLQLGGEPSYAVEIANQIARGDLSAPIEMDGRDQISVLHALKEMRESIIRIVSQVRSGTDTIATASSEIAAGNLDLSARTEHQASSLQETASSMEQLTTTVQQNANNAQQANTLAGSASDVARRGGELELAQRSAAAAREIKTLIGHSVEQVSAGTRLVDQAGATMSDIVASVERVGAIIAEITVASREQTVGIEQINIAIGNMDQVTQQNAALVEQAAAAAGSMQEQAAHLAEVVGQFKLEPAAGGQPRPPQPRGGAERLTIAA